MDRILIVDDESAMRAALTQVLERSGFAVTATENGRAGLAALGQGEFALVISDMRMPEMSGTELLGQIVARFPNLPVVLITAYGTIEDAVAAMKAGARDFLTKPFSPQDLLHVVRGVLHEPQQSRPGRESNFEEDGKSVDRVPTGGARLIVTHSPIMRHLLSIADGVAPSRASVLILGESGTGKELLARYIHAAGSRRAQPFVAVNCAALPRDLLESELFGHERGAFTGAISRKLGKFELANHGTLLLDEISEMEPALQAKLLRVLQEHEVDRLGGTRPIPIDTRVIATSNRALSPMVADGSFRRDLYYRLNVVPMTLPPLRERACDIDLLIDYFSARYAQASAPEWSEALRDKLRRHTWPGNIRELEHVVERAMLLAVGGKVSEDDLQLEDVPAPNAPVIDLTARAGLTVHEMERRLILETLKRTNNNRSHAAKMLGISIRTLRNKLNEYRTAYGGADARDAHELRAE